MLRDRLVQIDTGVNNFFKARQRNLLPRPIQNMAKKALSIPHVKETIDTVGVEEALHRARVASDFPMIAAIAYQQGFSRLHAVRLTVGAARDYMYDPNFLDASGHRLNMDQLKRRAKSAEALNTYVGVLNTNPMERTIVAKSQQLLDWQRRYNSSRLRRLLLPQSSPQIA
ncbi:MAG TPA: hypothetical protein VN711_02410 [Candidatus Saccharimonadales bacterium]|nr:hypothetical protein [Candidatus Saccharimonadales bacterium]